MKIKYIAIVLVSFVIIGLSFVCVSQYKALMKERVLNLTFAFSYMQEIINEEQETDFKNWDEKCGRLKQYQSRTTHGTTKMGDYIEISDLILQVSNIEKPKEQEDFLTTVQNKEVSWTVEKWRWSADWKS